MTAEAQDLQVVSSSETHCIATWHGVLIALWRKVPDLGRIDEVQKALSQLVRQVDSVCVLVVMEQGAGIPSSQARNGAADLMRSSRDSVVGWAVVIEGGGILRPTIRSVAVAAKLVARIKFPVQICATVNEATSWLENLPGAEACADSHVDHLPGAVAAARTHLTSTA